MTAGPIAGIRAHSEPGAGNYYAGGGGWSSSICTPFGSRT